MSTIPVSIGFLAAHNVPPGPLLAAAAEATRIGVSPVAALIAAGAMTEEAYYRALARQLALPFDEGDLALAAGARFPQSIRSGVAPVLTTSGRRGWLVAPAADRIEQLFGLARIGRLPRRHITITTPSLLAGQVRRFREAEVSRLASSSLPERDPALSARTSATPGQKIAGASFGFLLPFALLYGEGYWSLLCGICGLILSAAILLRIFATAASLDPYVVRGRELTDAELPIYTIAVALHREEEVVSQLISSLEAIDYPPLCS